MKLRERHKIFGKNYLLLASLSLLGLLLVLVATSRFGAGLSPDSVSYVGTARNLSAGQGFQDYNGSPMSSWPPLYPALLSLVGLISGSDPRAFAHVMNALFYGLTIFLGGLLVFKHLAPYRALAFVGTLAIVFSVPLFQVSVMLWSEPLFICLVLLSLLLADSYIEKNDLLSLILFSVVVSISSLTRYLGVSLIAFGLFIIFLFNRGLLREKIKHLLLFTFIAAIPLALWLTRNYFVLGRLFGPRRPSQTPLHENLGLLLKRLLDWYLPTENLWLILIATAVVVSLAALTLRSRWSPGKVVIRQVSPLIIFVTIYGFFLLISSTTTSYDQIYYRLLSPIFVPLTILLLLAARVLFEPLGRRFAPRTAHTTLIICLSVWLIFPITVTTIRAVSLLPTGRGYSSKAWKNSETIQTLHEQGTMESNCTIYTNGPDVAYILANLSAKSSPGTSKNNPDERITEATRLEGNWPPEGNACLVWFDRIFRSQLLSPKELQSIADIDLVAHLQDGAIYQVSKR